MTCANHIDRERNHWASLGLDLVTLRVFRPAVEERSLVRAAEMENLAVSAISRAPASARAAETVPPAIWSTVGARTRRPRLAYRGADSLSRRPSNVDASCSASAVVRGGRAVFEAPQHAYTRKLMAAVPVADPSRRHKQRALLEGEIPSPIRAVGDEPEVPPLVQVAPGHFVARHAIGGAF